MPDQQGATIITTVLPDSVGALKALLEDEVAAAPLESNPLVPFGQLTRVHFARWFVLDASRDALGRPTAPSLVFSSCIDGTPREHLDELLAVAGEGVARIYAHCEGCPGGTGDAAPSSAALLGYLERHLVRIDTLYIGTRGFTLERIRREAALHEALQTHLDEGMPPQIARSDDAREIRTELQRFAASRDDFARAREVRVPRRRVWPMPRDLVPLALLAVILLAFVALVRVSSFGTAVLVASAVTLALGALLGWTLRLKELTDAEAPAAVDAAHVRRLTRRENFIVQNQLGSITDVKEGLFRQLLLRAVLLFIDIAARYKHTRGRLGKIPTIHYARWIVVDEGRRLLFMSNFDGSWESYLGDFVDKAAGGLSAIWSNTDGFPRTRWLVRDGARDEQRFKAYTRASQVPTQVWYSAYEHLSVTDIRRNAAISEGLFGARDAEASEAWLALL